MVIKLKKKVTKADLKKKSETKKAARKKREESRKKAESKKESSEAQAERDRCRQFCAKMDKDQLKRAIRISKGKSSVYLSALKDALKSKEK